MASATPATNTYVEFWNEVMVEKFERFRNILMDGLSYHSRVPLADLDLAPGSKVLDVGCGWGDTAIALAQLTGPTGSVLGLDCCDAFLQKGRRDAEAAGLSNLSFVEADVQDYPFEPEYDLCFSRFGMMFFANPVAALRNVHRALKPGGRLVFVTWRPLQDNPWLGLPKTEVLRFLPPPGDDARTCGPGPFSMADTEVVTAQLRAAGFEDIAFQRVDGPVMVGSSVEQAMQFQLAIGPAGEIFREAGEVAEQRRGEIEEALWAQLADYEDNGEIIMGSSSWTITARRPAA